MNDRNKKNESRNYGANEIKAIYLKNLRKGLEYAIILHIVIITSYILISYINSLNAEDIKEKPTIIRKIDLSDIELPPSITEDETPITEVKEILSKVKDLGALEPVPVPKNLSDMLTIKTQDELDKIIGNVSREGDSLVAGLNNNITINDNDINDKIDKKIDNDADINRDYESFEVEVAPVCVNLEQISSTIVYPRVAVEAGIEDMVFMKMLVGTDGKVIKVGSIKGNEVFHDVLRDKAKDLEFTPGLQNGKSVNVWVTVPFKFKLEN